MSDATLWEDFEGQVCIHQKDDSTQQLPPDDCCTPYNTTHHSLLVQDWWVSLKRAGTVVQWPGVPASCYNVPASH